MAATTERLRREAARTEYPSDLPAIPPMPSARYADPGFHELELKHVFGKSWLGVAHLSELPEPGSYKLFEEMGRSIIISRGPDDQIRAFKNACRHRGSALVSEPTGTARRFVCPYHAWGYSAEGELKAVPEIRNFACVDKAAMSLISVRCEVWNKFIYINFDTDAAPLSEYMAPFDAELAGFPFDKMVVKQVIRREFDCNWKVAYDNFVEGYHVGVVHRNSIAPLIDLPTFFVEPLPFGHACLYVSKAEGKASLWNDEVVMDVPERFISSIVTIPQFPNSIAPLDPAGFAWQQLWPLGPDRSVMVNTLLGPEVEDKAADKQYWDNYLAGYMMVQDEDVPLFRSLQRSITQGDISQNLLSTQELYIQWHHEHLDQAIGIENIPEHLRVSQVLTGAPG